MPIIDPEARRIVRARLGRVVRPAEDREWYTEYGDHMSFSSADRVLRNVRTVDALIEGGFSLRMGPGPFMGEWAVGFEPYCAIGLALLTTAHRLVRTSLALHDES